MIWLPKRELPFNPALLFVMMSFTRKKLPFLIFSLALASQTIAFGMRIPERLPPTVVKTSFSAENTAKYGQAFGGQTTGISLKKHLIHDRFLRQNIDGVIHRQENQVQFQLDAGLTDRWVLGVEIPWIRKRQKSDLSLKTTSPEELTSALEIRIKKTIENLDSQTVAGVGDSIVSLGYDMRQSDRFLMRGGPGLRIPTGNTGKVVGDDSLSIGDRQTDVFGFLQLVFYSPTRGLQYFLHFELGSELRGRRETIDGTTGNYLGGNWAKAQAQWQFEQNSWIFGSNLLNEVNTASTIAGIHQGNNSSEYRVQFKVGYGNLAVLESRQVHLPYQIELVWDSPLALKLGEDVYLLSKNTPQRNHWKLTTTFYF